MDQYTKTQREWLDKRSQLHDEDGHYIRNRHERIEKLDSKTARCPVSFNC